MESPTSAHVDYHLHTHSQKHTHATSNSPAYEGVHGASGNAISHLAVVRINLAAESPQLPFSGHVRLFTFSKTRSHLTGKRSAVHVVKKSHNVHI